MRAAGSLHLHGSVWRNSCVVSSAPGRCEHAYVVRKVFTQIMLQLYEEAWSKGNVDVLDEVMAEGHIQRDMIWSGASSEGRAAMQKGITGVRTAYPDLTFTINTLISDADQGVCMVEWSAEGTFSKSAVKDGDSASAEKELFGGVSALSIVNNQIAETRVYRQALVAESGLGRPAESKEG